MNTQTKTLTLADESEDIVLKAGEFYTLQIAADLLCRGVENMQETTHHFKTTIDMIAAKHDIAPHTTTDCDKGEPS